MLNRLRPALARKPELILTPIVVLAGLVFWQFSLRLFGISELVLPLPSDIYLSLVDAVGEPTVWRNVGTTALEAGAGFGIATVVALGLAAIMTVSPRIEALIMPYVISTQTIPTVALAPLLLIWFGFGLESKVALAALTAFFPIAINALNGLKATSEDRRQLLVSFGASRGQLLTLLRLPTALPYVFAGLDIGIIFAILGAVVGEFSGASAGLGYQVLQASFMFDIPGMFAALVLLASLGLIGHGIVVTVRYWVVFWERPSAGGN